MTEKWLPVPGYEGLYEVSNLGRILSLPRTSTYGGLMKPVTNGSHLWVYLCRDGKKIQHYIHRVVLAAFDGPCPIGMECRHLDGDPHNNNISNLKWGTHVDNMADKSRHGTHGRGEMSSSAKLTETQVLAIRAALRKGDVGCKLAKEYNVSPATISMIGSNKVWFHI